MEKQIAQALAAGEASRIQAAGVTIRSVQYYLGSMQGIGPWISFSTGRSLGPITAVRQYTKPTAASLERVTAILRHRVTQGIGSAFPYPSGFGYSEIRRA